VKPISLYGRHIRTHHRDYSRQFSGTRPLSKQPPDVCAAAAQGKLGHCGYDATHRAHRHGWKYRLYDGSVRPETQAATAVAYKAGMATICLLPLPPQREPHSSNWAPKKNEAAPPG
jgi:hypothetical protein